jgi:hypothetical protein
LAALIGSLLARNAFNHYRLQNRGQVTHGKAIWPADHRQFKYSFKVADKEYVGIGMPGFGTPSYERIAVGQTLLVYYLPEDPEINCLGNPQPLSNNELTSLLLSVTFFPTVIVLRFWFWERKRKRNRVGQ